MAPGTPSSIFAKVVTVALALPSMIPSVYAAICSAVNVISLWYVNSNLKNDFTKYFFFQKSFRFYFNVQI